MANENDPEVIAAREAEETRLREEQERKDEEARLESEAAAARERAGAGATGPALEVAGVKVTGDAQVDGKGDAQGSTVHGTGGPEGSRPLAGEQVTELMKAQVERGGGEIPGVRDSIVGGLGLSPEQAIVKEKLRTAPRIAFFIPLDPGEKPGAYRSVTINTYRCEVVKGKMVTLPLPIAQILMQAYDIESETLNESEFNLARADAGTRDALGLSA